MAQRPVPVPALNVPGRQSLHWVSPVAMPVPAGHELHSVAVSRPGVDVTAEPAGHSVLPAFPPRQYQPAGQIESAVPSVSAYRPAVAVAHAPVPVPALK